MTNLRGSGGRHQHPREDSNGRRWIPHVLEANLGGHGPLTPGQLQRRTGRRRLSTTLNQLELFCQLFQTLTNVCSGGQSPALSHVCSKLRALLGKAMTLLKGMKKYGEEKA